MSTTYDGSDNFPTSITIPSDGDDKPVASVNAALEGLADRTTYLNVSAAEVGEHALVVDNHPSDPGDISGEFFGSTSWTKSPSVLVDVPSCQVGERLISQLVVVARFTNSTIDPSANTRLYAIDDQAGTPQESEVAGAHGRVGHELSEVDKTWFPIALAGIHTVAAAGTTRVGLEIRRSDTDPGKGLQLMHGVSLLIQRVRV